MKRTKLSFYFIFIAVFTFLVVFLLIIQKSYVNLLKPINVVKTSDITPLNSNVDWDIISEIEKRPETPIDANLEFVNVSDLTSGDSTPAAVSITPTKSP
jgi:hypothetical protein